jgi:transcriptional regulator with XRE-family HTH domain
VKDFRELRLLAGLTQQRLASSALIERSRLSLIETEQIEPTQCERERLLRALTNALEERAARVAVARSNLETPGRAPAEMAHV